MLAWLLYASSLSHHSKTLKCLAIKSNGMTVAGLEHIVEMALMLPTLELLDVGFYKSTDDMQEQHNNFQDLHGADSAAVDLLIRLVLVGGPLEKSSILFFAPNIIFSDGSCICMLYDLTCQFLLKKSTHSQSYGV
jgi:hypothetical protein